MDFTSDFDHIVCDAELVEDTCGDVDSVAFGDGAGVDFHTSVGLTDDVAVDGYFVESDEGHDWIEPCEDGIPLLDGYGVVSEVAGEAPELAEGLDGDVEGAVGECVEVFGGLDDVDEVVVGDDGGWAVQGEGYLGYA